MKRILRVSARAVRYGALAALLGLAAGSAAFRLWLIPGVDEFKGQLERRIGQLGGENIRIGHISATMWTGTLELVLREVSVLDDAGAEALRFAEIRLGIAGMASLMARDLRVAWLELRGTPLSLRRLADGSFGIVGLHAIETIPDWLRTLGSFRISDCRIDWQDIQRGGARLELGDVDLLLVSRGDSHRLSASLDPPAALAGTVRAGFDLRGDLFEFDTLSGRIYADAQELALTALDDELPASFRLGSGLADLRVWGELSAGRIESLAARFGGRNLRLEHRPSEEGNVPGLALAAVAGDVFWRRTPEGWRLSAQRLKAVSAGHEWPLSRIALAVNRGPGAAVKSAFVVADTLALDDFKPLWPMLGLPVPAPSGVLDEPRLGYENEGRPRFGLCTRFAGVVLPAREGVPGVAGLDGRICGSDERGAAVIGMQDGALDLAGMLPEPLLVKRAGMHLDWQRNGEGWAVRASRARVETDDWSLSASFGLGRDAGQGQGLRLDLQAEAGAAEAHRLKRYFPARAFPQLGRWLEQSLEQGRLDGARIRFEGPVAAFPFRKGEGVFEAVAGFSGVRLRYDPAWPVLRDAGGTVRFAGAGMEIDATGARLGGGEILGARARIADLAKDAVIGIEGRVSATLPQCLEFFRTTPLKPVADKLDASLAVSGDAMLDLALKVPLESKGPPFRLNGTARLSRTHIELAGLAEPVEDAKGELAFTEDGLVSGRLQGSWLRQALSATARRNGDILDVAVSGQLPVAALKSRFPSPSWRYLAGVVPLNLTMKLPMDADKGGDEVPLSLSSDLAGTRVALPAPLGKAQGERRMFRLDTRLGGAGKRVDLSFGADVTARFDLTGDDFRLKGVQLAIGTALPKIADASGLRILVRSPSLDLAPWADVFAAAEGGGRDGIGMDIKALDVQVGQLLWDGKAKGPAAVQAVSRAGGFRGVIDSDYVKGGFDADMVGGRLSHVKADLDFVKLSRLDEKAVASTDSWLDTLHPGSIPSLSLVGRHVLWHGFDVGRLQAEVDSQARGITLRSASLRSDNHELVVEQGEWTRHGGTDRTRISGKLKVNNSGMLAAVLGYPEVVRDTPADVDYKLNWAETPFGVSSANLAGTVDLKLGKGALLKVDVGIGRFLGLFSVGALWRRLSLDFSDLFGAGMAYDGIAGKLDIADGRAETKGFVIDGVAAKIVINGGVKLATREVDQVVTVIPNTSIALPVAGVLMGGPLGPAVGAAVGAGVFVADKMMNGQVERLTQTRYLVKGSLDNPVITKVTGDTPQD
ncbi:YhdP family protein [Methylococcus geothermalis]|uniref:TIGR02099 family protein n=1 Tax=Methylococcus geothermalis TaxID=2681310 RepID=A0A858QAU3_9GAMM|nr:YhdP family protein [Methylococcus geothermalis]QJD30943.1 TIGR02099 family protein [Methylococcus geothermalis]